MKYFYFFVSHGPGHSDTEILQYRHHKSQEYCAWHGHTAVVGAGALVDAGTKSSKFMGSAAPLELSSGAAGRAKLTTVAAFVSGLLLLLALLAVAVRSTSSRSTMSGSDSFMEHCGCAKAHQRRCGTAPVLAVVRGGRASAARACLQHAHAWLRSCGLSEFSSRLRRTNHW